MTAKQFTPIPTIPEGIDESLRRCLRDLILTLQVILEAIDRDVAQRAAPGPAPIVTLTDITGANPRYKPVQPGVVTCANLTGVAFPMLCYADTTGVVWRRADTGTVVS